MSRRAARTDVRVPRRSLLRGLAAIAVLGPLAIRRPVDVQREPALVEVNWPPSSDYGPTLPGERYTWERARALVRRDEYERLLAEMSDEP